MFNPHDKWLDYILQNDKFTKFLNPFGLFLGYMQIIVYFIFIIIKSIDLLYSYSSVERPIENELFDENDELANLSVKYWFDWVLLMTTILAILTVLPFIYGIRNKQHDFLLPWLVIHSMCIYFDFILRYIVLVVTNIFSVVEFLVIALQTGIFITMIYMMFLLYKKIELTNLSNEKTLEKLTKDTMIV